jgi:hypothetical protein
MTVITAYTDTGEVLVTHNEGVEFGLFCAGYESLAALAPDLTEGSTIVRTADRMLVKIPSSNHARPKTVLYIAEP